MRIVTVIPLITGIPYEELTYFSKVDVLPGDLVEVSIRSRVCKAIVIVSNKIEEERQSIRHASFNVKKISRIITPAFLPEYLWNALSYAASYQLIPLGALLYDLLSQKIDSLPLLRPQEHPKGHEILLLEQGYEHRITRYKTTIREHFSKKKSLVIFFPTITDIEHAEKHLSKGIEEYTAIFHSALTEKQYKQNHERIQRDDHPVLILATPTLNPWIRNDLGLVIIEREHSPYYVTHGDRGYDMRLIIKTLAEKSSTPCLLGSHTLSLYAHLLYKQKSAVELVPLQYRNDFPISIVPLTDENKTSSPYFSKHALTILQASKEQKNGHIFLYAHRKGMYPTTVCMDCGTLLTCDSCMRPYVLHKIQDKRFYVCHGCEKTIPLNEDTKITCTHCGGWRLATLGIATTGVEEELKHLGIPLYVIDADRTNTRAKAKKVYKAWCDAPYGVLIGTEMAHNLIEACDSVIVLSMDSLFSLPEYRTDEKILNLVTEMAEKVRKVNNEPVGPLLFQTRLHRHPLVKKLTSPSYREVYNDLLHEREEFLYPPYYTVIKATFTSLSEEMHGRITEALESYVTDWYERGTTSTIFVHIKETTWAHDAALREKVKQILYEGNPVVNPLQFFS
jgi:primosomal protein N' (replication factor Y)